MNPQTPLTLLSTAETATLLGVSTKWLYRNRQQPKPLPYIKLGRTILYQQCDVQRWLKRWRLQ